MNSAISELIAERALFVANHSGGKDSQAMLIELLRIIPSDQIIVVHASLGKIEWPGALELAETQARFAGLPFIVATARKTFFEMVERRFQVRPDVPSWPSSSTRQCTSDLKRDPIRREVRRYAKKHGYSKIVNCLGLRAQESPGRAKKIDFKCDASLSNGVATWYEWLPIHAWDTGKVFSVIDRAGQKPHHAYSLGNDRLSCIFCIMGSKRDLKNGSKHHPELLLEYRELESKTGYTMHMSRIPLHEITC